MRKRQPRLTCLALAAALELGCSVVSDAVDCTQPGGIDWDPCSRVLIEADAGYGRMIRLDNGEMLASYELRGEVWCRTSADDGRTWGPRTRIAKYAHGHAANPELLQLASGTVLCPYNERPLDGQHPFAIALVESPDSGRTWSEPVRLYEADTRRENGCWEPAAIELPTGEVQIFFANENPYRSSGEQEISMLRRPPGAPMWEPARRVSLRRGHRDGMPVPLVLAGGAGTAVAIEDNGPDGAPRFRPAIIWSAAGDNWTSGHVDGTSERRWTALSPPLPPNGNAAAPYIRQMPDGRTVLSVQVTDAGRDAPRMMVYVGDDRARAFSNGSVPFDVAPGVACAWNSLCVKDPDTVTAISGTTVDGVSGVWAIDGRLRERSKRRRNAKVASSRH